MSSKSKTASQVSARVTTRTIGSADKLQEVVSALTRIGVSQTVQLRGESEVLGQLAERLGGDASVVVGGATKKVLSSVHRVGAQPVSIRVTLRGDS